VPSSRYATANNRARSVSNRSASPLSSIGHIIASGFVIELRPHCYRKERRPSMKIKLTSVHVDDQEKALRFYTEVLGFVKKTDVSAEEYRWLTVTSPEEPEGTELLLEPNNNPAARTYQQALFEQNVPAAMFFTDDVQADYERMKARGAEFVMAPTDTTGSKIAQVNDTCGNLVQLTQLTWQPG
jgi:predicted enzyme related to lactoylglutathione lyase